MPLSPGKVPAAPLTSSGGALTLQRAHAPRAVEAQPRTDHGICGTGRGAGRRRCRAVCVVLGASLHLESGPQRGSHHRSSPYDARSRCTAETASPPALPCRPPGLPLGPRRSLAQMWWSMHGQRCVARPCRRVPRLPWARACLAVPCPLEPRAWVQGPVRRRCQSQGQRDRQPRTN